jgi:hypothetical protein
VEANRLPLVGMRLLLSYAVALCAFEAARISMPPDSAGSLSILVVLISPWVLLELSGRSALKAAASAWDALVLWFSYNHHEYYGPQTFQFEGYLRKPTIRKVSAWAVMTLLAAAVVSVTSAPPWDARRVISSVIANPPQVFRKPLPQLDRPSDEVRMSREQERYYKMLPTDSEKRRYRDSLARREIARDEAAESERGGSIEDQLRSLALTVFVPPILLFTILGASYGRATDVLKED